MYQYTDDPARDWDAYCREQEKQLEKLPRCSMCGERIQDVVYDIDGNLYCDDCIFDCKKPLDNYIEY